MIYFINEKLKCAEKEGFKSFSQNWLLLYNNWSPTPSLDDPKVISLLNAELFEVNPWNTFSRIFILGDELLLDATASSGINSHRVVANTT